MISVIAIDTISVSIVGKFIQQDFENIGRAQNYLLLTLTSLVHAFTAGLENIGTIALQNKDYNKLVIMKNRAKLVHFIFTITLISIHYVIDGYVSQAIYGSKINYERYMLYVRTFLPTVIIDAMNNINMRYFNLLRKTYLNSIVYITGALCHLLLSYLFITKFNFGLIGINISSLISKLLIFILFQILNLKFDDYYHLGSFFSWNTFKIKELWEYFKFSIQTCLALYLLWIIPTIISYIANFLNGDVNAYSVFLITWNIYSLLYSFHFSTEVSISILISKLVANDKLMCFKQYLLKCFAFCLICICILLSAFIALIRYLVFIFTDEDAEPVFINITTQSTYICFIACFFDFIQIFFDGCLRGLGLSKAVFIVTLIIGYIIIPSLGYLFGFVLQMEVNGLWIAIGAGYILCTMIYLIILYKVDYDKLRKKFIDKLEATSKV